MILRERQEIGPLTFEAFADEPRDLRDHWVVARKRSRLIGAILFSVVGLTALVVFNLTSLYTATGMLLLEPVVPTVIDTKAPTAEPQVSAEHDFYKTQYDILQSRSLAAKVIERLGLDQNPLFNEQARPCGLVAGWIKGILAPERKFAPQADAPNVSPALVDQYLSRLRIEPKFGTELAEVAFTTPDPELSSRIVNAHVDAYIRRGMELKADAARNAEQFLQGKLAELKERVEKSEAALNAYRREHGVTTFSLDEEGKGQMLEERLTNLNNALAKVEADRIELEAQHDLVQRGEADSLPVVMQNLLIQNLKQQAAQLAAQYAAMSNQFNAGYYQPLDDLKAKLEQSRAQLTQEIARAAKGVESDYTATSARQQMLENEIASVKSQALALNDASLQDAVLVREVDASRNLYKSVLERVRELDVSADAPASNVSVVDRAEPPRWPSSPKRLLSLGLSTLIGLIGGLGAAFFLELLDDRFKTPEQIERELRVPSLALVPDFNRLTHNGYGHRSLEHSGRGSLLVHSVEKNGSDGAIVVSADGWSPAGETFHSIRSALLFSQPGGKPRSVLITSAVEDEGKTVTALNVAMAFALTGGKILLIDADLRKSRCHEVLGIENHSGLSDVLTGQKQCDQVIHRTASGLFFLSAGAHCPNPAALLGSGAMRDLLTNLCKQYDHVLIDSPPLMPVSDATAMAALVDGVLMIVRASTSKKLVRRACAQLRHVGANVFGVALTRVDTASPDYYYYNPYTSYYYHKDSPPQ